MVKWYRNQNRKFWLRISTFDIKNSPKKHVKKIKDDNKMLTVSITLLPAYGDLKLNVIVSRKYFFKQLYSRFNYVLFLKEKTKEKKKKHHTNGLGI